MDLVSSPLKIENLTESKPWDSRFLARGLAVCGVS